MSTTPADLAIDSTLSLVREGYPFMLTRCQRFGTDIFTARLLGKPAVCIHGREAARLFYDETKLMRQGAVPRRVVTSLFGKGGVQGLDGEAHRRRKAAFLEVLSGDNLQQLLDQTAEEWRVSARAWERTSEIVLFDETQLLLTRAVCRWAGVPLLPSEVATRARDLGRMVDAFGGLGSRLWRGKLARARSERWMEQLVLRARRGQVPTSGGRALGVLAELTDDSGRLLSPRIAAVEVLNVIRPTAAIAWYICFAALALRAHPASAASLAAADAFEPGGYAERFAQEVRRYYPFTPFLGAKVKAPFQWRGHSFKAGTLVLLDVYGTLHDPQIWPEPERFDPARFEASAADEDLAFIPQGGGEALGHRCAGEWVTRYNLQLALDFLTRRMTYQVSPTQDLRIDLSRMPTLPSSGFVLQDVKTTPALDEPAPRLARPHPPLRVAS